MSKFIGRRTIIQDGYTAENILKFVDLDINGGVKNGLVRVNHSDNTSTIDFPKYTDQIGRVRYNLSVPNDYVESADIIVKLFWSSVNNGPGNIRWRIRYRIMTSDINDIHTPLVIVSYSQLNPISTNRLTDTGDNLFVAAGDANKGDLLALNVERDGSILDTYDDTIRLHLVRLEYFGRGVR